MDNNEQRDPDEERYNREFCIPCGMSPCTWDGRPDGFHTDDGPDPGPAPARDIAPLRPPEPPGMTHRQLAARLNKAGHRACAVDLLATSPGLRPHAARLAAGHCEDDPGRPGWVTVTLPALLRAWADEQDTWMAGRIAGDILLEACAEEGITGRAFAVAALAVGISRSFAQPMGGHGHNGTRLRKAG